MAKGRLPSALRLEPVPEASAQARRYVRSALSTLDATSLLDAALLGVSELVTNAAVHAQTAITVAIFTTEEGRVRIEVGDDSAGQPVRRRSDPRRTTGRGLLLLSAYGDWGVAASANGRGGKTVWFEPIASSAGELPALGASRRTQIRR